MSSFSSGHYKYIYIVKPLIDPLSGINGDGDHSTFISDNVKAGHEIHYDYIHLEKEYAMTWLPLAISQYMIA